MSKSRNIVVIGKNGFVAQHLLPCCPDDTLVTSTRDADNGCLLLDLSAPNQFDYSKLGADSCVVLLASISSPDICNNDYEMAFAVNVTGTLSFIEKAVAVGSRVIFFSSDTVLGRPERPIGENQPIHPFGRYAEMKAQVEKAVHGNKNVKIFRLSYVLAHNDKYFKYLRECAKNGTTAEVFHPFSRHVVHIDDVVSGIKNLVVRWDDFDNQIFHICGQELVSRVDIAEKFSRLNNKALKFTLVEPDETFFQARPKQIPMQSLYFSDLLGREPNSIEKAIKIELSKMEEYNGN